VHPEVVDETGWREIGGQPADLEIGDTADLEVCGTNNPPTTSGCTVSQASAV
jgi:hypothetical protein